MSTLFPAPLLDLMREFAVMSIFAFGGMVAVLPELQRQVVDHHAWMSERTFADLYGIGYAMPGPNVLVATLVGYHVGGAWGAFVGTLAMLLPSTLLAMVVANFWHGARDAAWRRPVQAGLISIVAGLTLAGGFLVARAAAESDGHINWSAYALTVASVVIVMRTSIHPLWLIAIGAVLGLIGFV